MERQVETRKPLPQWVIIGAILMVLALCLALFSPKSNRPAPPPYSQSEIDEAMRIVSNGAAEIQRALDDEEAATSDTERDRASQRRKRIVDEMAEANRKIVANANHANGSK